MSRTRDAGRGAGAPATQRALLLADGDAGGASEVAQSLSVAGFSVTVATDGEAALELAGRAVFDALLLEVELHGIDGLEVCRRLRALGDDTPVLFLAEQASVSDRVAGLDAGGDDYLLKPPAMDELVARIRALLRRRPVAGRVLRFGDLSMDLAGFEVRRAGRVLPLTPREFGLLKVLLGRAGQVVSRQTILAEAWGSGYGGDVGVVDVYVLYLRRKLEAGGLPRVVQTVRSAGYVLRESTPGEC